ncbi:MAG: winged helix-turn-helix domain-containing protein [Myxococcota bacterium]
MATLIHRLRARTGRPLLAVRGVGYALATARHAEPLPAPPATIWLEGAVLDLAHHRVRHGTGEILLTPAEARLLGVLAQAAGAPVPRSTLLHAALGRRDPGVRAVDGLVCRLRRKLGPLDATLQTVHGRGYALSGGVVLPEPQPDPPPVEPVPRGDEGRWLGRMAVFAGPVPRADLEALGRRIPDTTWARLQASPWVTGTPRGPRVRDRPAVLRQLDPAARRELRTQHEHWLAARIAVPEELCSPVEVDALRRVRADAAEVGDRTADSDLQARCRLLEGALLILDGSVREAWRVLAGLLSDGVDPALEGIVHLHAARAAMALGRHGDAESLVASVHTPEGAFLAATMDWWVGRTHRARQRLEALCEDPAVGPRAQGTLPLFLPPDERDAAYRIALDRLARTSDVRSWGRTAGNFANHLIDAERYPEARPLNALARDVCRAVGDRRLLVVFEGDEGVLMRAAGEPGRAAERFARNATTYRAWGMVDRTALALAQQAQALAEAGRHAECDVVANHAREEIGRSPPSVFARRAEGVLAELPPSRAIPDVR